MNAVRVLNLDENEWFFRAMGEPLNDWLRRKSKNANAVGPTLWPNCAMPDGSAPANTNPTVGAPAPTREAPARTENLNAHAEFGVLERTL